MSLENNIKKLENHKEVSVFELTLNELINLPNILDKEIKQMHLIKLKRFQKDYDQVLIPLQIIDNQVNKIEELQGNTSILDQKLNQLQDKVNKSNKLTEQLNSRKQSIQQIEQSIKSIQLLLELPKLILSLAKVKDLTKALDALGMFRRIKQLAENKLPSKLLNKVEIELEEVMKGLILDSIKTLSQPKMKLIEIVRCVDLMFNSNLIEVDEVGYLFLYNRLLAFYQVYSSWHIPLEDSEQIIKLLKLQLDQLIQFYLDLQQQIKTVFPYHKEELTYLMKNMILTKLIQPFIKNVQILLIKVRELSKLITLFNQIESITPILFKLEMDFSPILIKYIESHTLNLFNQQIELNFKQLIQTFENYGINRIHTLINNSNSNEIIQLNKDSIIINKQILQADFTPPKELLYFPPLAHLLNQLLFLFNQLRSLAFHNNLNILKVNLEKNFILLIQSFLKLQPKNIIKFKDDKEEERYNLKLKAFNFIYQLLAYYFIPYVTGALFNGVYDCSELVKLDELEKLLIIEI